MDTLNDADRTSYPAESVRRCDVLCVGGLAEDGTLFDGVRAAADGSPWTVATLDLPGFGRAPAWPDRPATLNAMAAHLADAVDRSGASVVVAHSIASVIASLAARISPRLRTIVSLEGNLVVEDGFFTGLAVEYDDPAAYVAVLLARVEDLGSDPIHARYGEQLRMSDPRVLWELGRDATAMASVGPPGELLHEVESALYVHNPDNLSPNSRRWLDGSDLPTVVIREASHWAPVDAPVEVWAAIRKVL